ncbi:hypothetical protein Aph01nite_68060 [Acrocarpospora phusangensis]|uniref:Uncharacterized protein n=1 Tax=Acrocarpospora phusangensis TaxID=1070424 RepID=A0A919QGP7_9ACTN|nr:hypothetical protein [Acrocarpospora phusangensis]GIH28496.1 hypothetical protein Aph01nite_68060 [Acrocarpospora phusangensis]
MNQILEQQREYERKQLTALSEELTARGITTVLLVDQNQRLALDVVDTKFRTRRIYVHLSFWWFYWGDQADERVSCLRLRKAVLYVEAAAQAGWRDGEQADLIVDLRKVADAYHS